MIDTKELNEHFCDDDKPQYDEDGFCRHCGESKEDCSEYKCWI